MGSEIVGEEALVLSDLQMDSLEMKRLHLYETIVPGMILLPGMMILDSLAVRRS